SPRRLDLWLAWVIASLIVLTMANAFPIITLELQGMRQDSTLFAATRAMYAAGLDMVALLVLITTIVFPFIELLLLLSVLWPLY
ncbi:paraquat-inducible protein A, partial [Acinetobacter baumannii]